MKLNHLKQLPKLNIEKTMMGPESLLPIEELIQIASIFQNKQNELQEAEQIARVVEQSDSSHKSRRMWRRLAREKNAINSHVVIQELDDNLPHGSSAGSQYDSSKKRATGSEDHNDVEGKKQCTKVSLNSKVEASQEWPHQEL